MAILVKLNDILIKNKIRAKQLAYDTKVKEQTISLIKNGKTKGINIHILDKICLRLGCHPEDILSYKDDYLDCNTENNPQRKKSNGNHSKTE